MNSKKILGTINPLQQPKTLLDKGLSLANSIDKKIVTVIEIADLALSKNVIAENVQDEAIEWATLANTPGLSAKIKTGIRIWKFFQEIYSDSSKKSIYIDALRAIGKDPLTNLDNRKTFFCALEQVIEDEKNAALMMIDISNFKHINDTEGQYAGDEILISFAQTLQYNFRTHDKDDTVHLLAQNDEAGTSRLGGDEFAIILTDGDGLNSESLDTLCLNKGILLLGSETVIKSMKKYGLQQFGIRIGADMVSNDPIDTMKRADHKIHTRCKLVIKKDSTGMYTVYRVTKNNSLVTKKTISNNSTFNEENGEVFTALATKL